MSAIKILIESDKEYSFQILGTMVKVDGKFAYYSANSHIIEKERIEKLLELMAIENVEVEVK